MLKTAKAESEGAVKSEITNLSKALNEIIIEKKIQYTDQTLLEILFKNELPNDVFVFISQHEFKCAISNLINNSVEAIKDSGQVTVTLTQKQNAAVIEVKDTGHGIPESVLRHLGKKPVTSGKEDSLSGTGIGVYNAVKLFESASGAMSFESVVGSGALVRITLPVAEQTLNAYI